MLSVSMYIHSGRYRCTYCGIRFHSSTLLVVHKRLRMEEKPFECNVCGKRLTQSVDLHKHSRIHSGQKPYNCDVCYETFRSTLSHESPHWRQTIQVPCVRNHLNVLFVTNDSQHRFILLDTAEFTVDRNHTTAMYVMRRLDSLLLVG